MRFLIEERRKMLTLNLIGIWKRRQPCTRQMAKMVELLRLFARASISLIHFLIAIVADAVAVEHETKRDSDSLGRLKFQDMHFFSLLFANKKSNYQSMGMIDQWIGWNFKQFNTAYCGNICFSLQMNGVVSGSSGDNNSKKNNKSTWNWSPRFLSYNSPIITLIFFSDWLKHIFFCNMSLLC